MPAMQSRRLSWIAAFLALAIAAAAHASETPRRGGTLVYAVDAEPPNYDCQGTTTFAAMQTLSPHYSRLLAFDPDNYPGIKTEVARSYEVSADKLIYTVKLKPGVKFHDGSALTSADVKATYDRTRNPPQGVISVRKAAYEDIAAIDTPDAETVIFRLSKPNSSMLLTLASPWNCLLSAAKIKDDPRWPEKNIMGSGPYRFTGHVSGSHWDGARFDDYFEPGKPYLDGFRAQFMKGAAMVNALEGKRIHAEFRGITPAERDKLKSVLGDTITITESPWICKFDVFFNTKKKPYDDVRVRQALSLAIDRWKGAEAMSRIAFVRSVGATLRPGSPLAMRDDELARLPGFGRDGAAARAEARRLLKEAGQENLKFTLLNRNVPMPFTPVAVYIIDQWKQVGVQAEHSQLDVSQQKRALLSGQYDVGLDANCFDMDEPNNQLLLYISSSRSPINLSHYEDAELDALFEKQKRATDEASRVQYIRAFEARLLQQSYTAPIVWWHRIVAHSSDLRGWKILPSHYLNQDLAGVWLAR
jgi:peptide/nickel transport system substrate-binding protein